MESQIDSLLKENVSTIHSLRANLLAGEFKANLALMRKFQNNVQEVEAIFGRLPFRLPELPEEARVDTRLIRS